MKLLNKRTVFLSSADRASGDLGQFAVPMPLDFTFDPTSVFKLFVSQINMRNTFFAIRPDNCPVQVGTPKEILAVSIYHAEHHTRREEFCMNLICTLVS
jgi:hypothetical protein